MRTRTKITRYVEAARELAALKRQREEYPELASNRKWLDEYNLAVGRTHEYLRVLTGGELAQAQRELRAGTR